MLNRLTSIVSLGISNCLLADGRGFFCKCIDRYGNLAAYITR